MMESSDEAAIPTLRSLINQVRGSNGCKERERERG